MNHLTDEQLAGWLAGEADQETCSHLESCPQCGAEALGVREGIMRYSITMRRQAAQAQMARLSRNFAPSKALARHRMRWVGAGVLALVLAGQTAWLIKSRPTPPVTPRAGGVAVSSQTADQSVTEPATYPAAYPATYPAAYPATQSATLLATQLSDDELLEAVNNDLSREVPLALAPVSAITSERNRMAASAVAASTGNASR